MSMRRPSGFIRPSYNPLEVADAPTSPGASAGNQTASVSFTAPADQGGSAITNYYAVSNPGGITSSSVTSPVSVSGLTNGTEYTFTVWGENSYGPSPYSAPTSGVTPAPDNVEDVFNIALYQPNSNNYTVTNNINLSSSGGLVWIKSRQETDGTTTAVSHGWWDTARGVGTSGSVNKALSSNLTSAENLGWSDADYVSAFNSNGFKVSNAGGVTAHRIAAHLYQIYAAWTFRKAPKFFDMVTYTGNGTARTIAHNLGSTPGFIVVKCTSNSATDWAVYHRSLGATKACILNGTDTAFTISSYWNDTEPTSTEFSVGTFNNVNTSGYTYVAYLFAHDAGGFGASGADSIISCGSFTTDGGGRAIVNLGWEPQWILAKRTNSTGSWFMGDELRRWCNSTGNPGTGGDDARLYANTDTSENTSAAFGFPTSTGFEFSDSLNSTYIYIAIRRPTKTPVSGSSVYLPLVFNGSAGDYKVVGFDIDMQLIQNRNGNTQRVYTNILGVNTLQTNTEMNTYQLQTATAGSALGVSYLTKFFNNRNFDETGPGFMIANDWASTPAISWNFKRAPGFFDIVTYNGNSISGTTISHNLGVAPEMMWVKCVSAGGDNTYDWTVYHSGMPSANYYLKLNNTDSYDTSTAKWNDTAPTSSVFTIGNSSSVNSSGQLYVAYLFASIAGVSKVGSYTGNGTTVTVDCGFSSAPRYLLIRRGLGGNWYVWDSARGFVFDSYNPYMTLNTSNSEVSVTEVQPTSSGNGFKVSQNLGSLDLNRSGNLYLYYAIA